MVFKSIIGVACACLAVVSFNAKAVVLNTLNGVDYEWLELTETTGLSRDQVDILLSDSDSALYGYQYASRTLMEELLLSYTSWDGLNGWHSAAGVVQGADAMINDYGLTYTYTLSQTSQVYTLEDTYLDYDTLSSIRGIYGLSGECGSSVSCFSSLSVVINNGTSVAVFQDEGYGFDATLLNPSITDNSASHTNFGSYLVRTAVVPIPAAIWLFGSGLIGLIGLARRKV